MRTAPSVTKKLTLALLAVVAVVTLVATAVLVVQKDDSASAVKASDFNPGRIIDDAVFYNASSMTSSQIQAFLDAKNPHCDTNGTGRATDWGRPDITRATLASYIRNGTHGYNKNTNFHAPPYTCLKDFKQDTPQVAAASGLCEAIPARSNRTAAQIIHDVARACGINPQVFLVLLEKEQSLVTDIWPLNLQYQRATGFACPDNVGGACDPSFNGFFRQVYAAGRQFKLYQSRPNDYNYRAGVTNNIFWQTNGGNFVSDGRAASRRNGQCGYSRVHIENQATAALYIYTPYRPNQAAMANYPGTGDACSAYGNRNFWFIFNNWFGSTHSNALVMSENLKISPSTIVEGGTALTSFVLRNNSSVPQTITEMTVAVRDEDNNNFNFPAETGITIEPGQEYKYYQERVLPNPGRYNLWIAIRTPAGDWSRTWPKSVNKNIIRDRTITVEANPDVALTQELSLSPASDLSTDDTVTATFTIKNNDSRTAKIRELTVAGRDANNSNVNFESVKDISLQPGQTYQYSKKRQFSSDGDHRFWIAIREPSGDWSRTWPKSTSADMTREINTVVTKVPKLSVTRYLRYSPSPALAGQPTAVSFTVKNNESSTVTVPALRVLAVDSKGKRQTFPIVKDITLPPAKEYQYYTHHSFENTGNYTISVQAQLPSGVWSDTWLKPQEDWMRLDRNLVVKTPNVTLERILKYSPVNPKVGTDVGSSFLLRNNESRPVTISEMTVAGRDKAGNVVNFPAVTNVTIEPGQTYQYYEFRKFTSPGVHNFWIATREADSSWSRTWPYSSQTGMIRDRTATVKP